MALTNEQYDSLMRQYNHKQMRNHQIVAFRTKELYSAVPTLASLDEEVTKVSISSISSMFSGKDMEEASASSKAVLDELHDKRIRLITSAGFPADYLEPPYDCPDCKDTGYIAGARCHCFKQAAINLVYSQSNISTILSKENFDNYNLKLYSDDVFEDGINKSAKACAQTALDEAQKFVQNFKKDGGNMLLAGHVGTGKTFLSNCIAKALLDEGFSVIYFTAFELFDIFEKQTFNRNIDVSDIHDHIFDCDLLIIDDLGTEMSTSFTNSRLFQCLNERMLRGKSTIISTNLSLNELRDVYGERTSSRILANYTCIRLIGTDLRRKVKNN